MSAAIQQMWFLLTLGFQALKYQGKQSFFHVREVVICASFLCLLRSVWNILQGRGYYYGYVYGQDIFL